jgi:hypothetical protein
MEKEKDVLRRIMSIISVAVIAAAIMAISAMPALAAPNQEAQWGQAIKACNQTPGCYPNGGSRGSYVNGQAQDTQDPGYGGEIHSLANPGDSDPSGVPAI